MKEFDQLLAQLEDCHCAEGECQCDDVLDHLFELIDNQGVVPDAHRLLRHAAKCPSCSQEIKTELRVRGLLRSACCHDTAPEALRMRVSQLTYAVYTDR